MGVPLRKLWKNKPKQYGPWSIVHAALQYNAEKFYGIDSSKIIFALPMWSNGDQKDYSKNNISCINSEAVFTNNSLNFVASNDSNILIPSFGVNNILSSLDALTVVQIARPNTQTTSSDQAIMGSWGDTQILIWFDAGNDVWQAAIRDTTNDQITVQPGLIQPTVKKDIIIGTLNGNEFSLHVNGIFGGSDSVPSFGVIKNVIDPIAIGASYESGIVRPFDGTIDLTVILKTSINSSQTGLFSENPWQLFQPVPQKTIFLPQEGGGLTLNLSDTITLSDAIINSIRLNKTDTISLSDNFSKTLNLNKSDIIGLSDEISKEVNIFKDDTITLSDQINTLIALTLSLSDTITMSDSISKQPGIVKADTITMEDAFSKVSEFVRTFSDQIDMSDQISKEIGITKADIITLSDTFSTSEEVIYALVNFLAKERVFNFTAKNKTFNFTAKNKNFNFGADPRGKKP